MKFLKLLAAPVFAGLLLMAGTANAAKVTMNIGYSVNEGHPYGTFMHLFADRFQTLSGGTVRVKVHCCHKMGSEQEQFKKLQLGTLDGTMIAQNNAGPFFPKIDLLVLPYMIQNYDNAVKWLTDQLVKRFGVICQKRWACIYIQSHFSHSVTSTILKCQSTTLLILQR